MAGDVAPSGGDDGAPMAGINITPFVDVVLVLLVIFMITAPVLNKEAINIKLPQTGTSDGKVIQTLGVAINAQGQILLNGVLTTDAALVASAKQAVKENPETKAIISADKDAKHGDVVKAIDLIKTAGLEKFAVQIERQ